MSLNGILLPKSDAPTLSERDIYNFYGGILSYSLPPAFCIVAAIICTIVGIRLLRSSGAVTTQVISPQDYQILGPAIAGGNEQAITQFIRLSSLSGMTGTFTKIGLTGLPLATIFLTILLAIMGLANPQFFDLAKLTLGAFLGSFVQRQSDATARSPAVRNS
jgi:spore maturation protein SpmB